MNKDNLIEALKLFPKDDITIDDIKNISHRKNVCEAHGIQWSDKMDWSCYEGEKDNYIFRIYYNRKNLIKSVYCYEKGKRSNKRIFKNEIKDLKINLDEFFTKESAIISCGVSRCLDDCTDCLLNQDISFKKLLKDANVLYENLHCMDILVNDDILRKDKSYIKKTNKRR